MGRIATSFIAVSIVLGVVSIDFADIVLAQEAGELRSAPSDGSASAPAGTDTTPAGTGSVPAGATTAAGSPAAVGAPASEGTASAPNQTDKSAVTDSSAVTTADGTKDPAKKLTPKPSLIESLLGNPMNLILLMFVALYVFLLFGPKAGRKEEKAMKERLANLKKNDRVVLTSGIHGIVANIHSEAGTVTLKVDDTANVKLTVDRASIRSVEA